MSDNEIIIIAGILMFAFSVAFGIAWGIVSVKMERALEDIENHREV